MTGWADGVDKGILADVEALMALAPAGFAVALHVRYQAATYLFQTYPEAWREEYSRDGLVLRDPIVAWVLAGHVGATTWAALDDGDPDGVLACAARHGLAHGVAIVVVEGGSRSFAAFARSDRPFAPDEVVELEKGLRRLHDLTAAGTPLPAAERERLRLLSVAFTHP